MADVSTMAVILFASGLASGGHIGVGWSPAIPDAPGDVLVYNVYRSTNGAPYRETPHRLVKPLRVNITGGLVAGALECFEITATENGVESGPSVPACIVPTP